VVLEAVPRQTSEPPSRTVATRICGMCRYPESMHEQHAHTARSGAWAAVVAVCASGAWAIWQAAVEPGSHVPMLPAYGFGLLALGALYMTFATACGWPPAVRSVPEDPIRSAERVPAGWASNAGPAMARRSAATDGRWLANNNLGPLTKIDEGPTRTARQLKISSDRQEDRGRVAGSSPPTPSAGLRPLAQPEVRVCPPSSATRDEIKAYLQNNGYSSFYSCSICETSVLGKNLLIHLDRKHPRGMTAKAVGRASAIGPPGVTPTGPSSSSKGRRDEIKSLVRSAGSNQSYRCMSCGVELTGRNYLRHFDKMHG
jgi:hypothetical protein